jgi:hypothetical protein
LLLLSSYGHEVAAIGRLLRVAFVFGKGFKGQAVGGLLYFVEELRVREV